MVIREKDYEKMVKEMKEFANKNMAPKRKINKEYYKKLQRSGNANTIKNNINNISLEFFKNNTHLINIFSTMSNLAEVIMLNTSEVNEETLSAILTAFLEIDKLEPALELFLIQYDAFKEMLGEQILPMKEGKNGGR